MSADCQVFKCLNKRHIITYEQPKQNMHIGTLHSVRLRDFFSELSLSLSFSYFFFFAHKIMYYNHTKYMIMNRQCSAMVVCVYGKMIRASSQERLSTLKPQSFFFCLIRCVTQILNRVFRNASANVLKWWCAVCVRPFLSLSKSLSLSLSLIVWVLEARGGAFDIQIRLKRWL